MRVPLTALLALGIACQPGTTRSEDQEDPASGETGVTEAQRTEMTDSVNALVQRQEAEMEKPDTSVDHMADYLPTGEVAVASNGELTLSRDSLEATAKEAPQPNVTVEYPVKKIDVVAPGVAAVTVRYIGRQDQGTRIAEVSGVWSAVMAVRDGRTRVIQQHQSSKPPVLIPKGEASR